MTERLNGTEWGQGGGRCRGDSTASVTNSMAQRTEGLFTGGQGPHQGYATDDQHKETGTRAGGGWNSTCVLATKPGILVQG